MNITRVQQIDDPVLDPFRELRSRRWAEQHGLFVVEGQLLVERLVASEYPLHSVVLDDEQYAKFEPMLPAEVVRYVIDSEMMEQLVGFRFHRGILGCGVRKPLLSVATDLCAILPGETLVGLIDVQDPANVGGILRSCAGLGVKRVLIGPGTADPLSRRALRVAMGSALGLELYRSTDVFADLRQIHQLANTEIIAADLGAGSSPLEQFKRSGPILILFGNERHGLPPAVVDAADRRVRIDMQQGVDSLNVAVAAGIAVYYFCRLA